MMQVSIIINRDLLSIEFRGHCKREKEGPIACAKLTNAAQTLAVCLEDYFEGTGRVDIKVGDSGYLDIHVDMSGTNEREWRDVQLMYGMFRKALDIIEKQHREKDFVTERFTLR